MCRVVERGHQHDRCRRTGERHHQQVSPASSARNKEGGEHHRPNEVELLLDGEAPEVLQRTRRAELGEVARPLRGEVPVAVVEERGQSVARERVPLDWIGP